MWKEISKESEQLKNDSFFELGDGYRIKFKEDVWCGETPLRVSFPSLYALANSKGATTSELWENTGGNGVWNLKFNRGFNDWELECIQNFLGLLNSKKANSQKRDNLVWKVAKNGSFTMKENFTLGERKPSFSSSQAALEFPCFYKSELFHLRGLVDKSANYEPIEKKRTPSCK